MGFAVRIPREFCSALMFHTMRAGFFCGSSSRVFSSFEYPPQDKFACDVLREAEAVLKVHPDAAPVVWSKVIQALVGHPRLFLEGGDGQILICRESDPAIVSARLEDALQYRIYPESSEGEECVVRLERGDQVIVYRFPPAMRQLRRLLSGDFRIPDVESPENKKILENLIRNFRIVSDAPLPGVDLPAHPTDPVPFLQLIPRERGLRATAWMRSARLAVPSESSSLTSPSTENHER